MKFSRAAAFLACTLPLLAAANPAPNNPTVTVTVTAAAPTVTTVSQCNTGSIECCDQTLAVSLILLLFPCWDVRCIELIRLSWLSSTVRL